MRIAVVVYEFPVPSETFVVTHVEGLLERGHEVVVIPVVPSRPRAVSESARALAARVTQQPSWDATLASAARVASFTLTRKKVNPRGPRWRAQFAARFAALGPVDVVHAHFESGALAAQEMRNRGFFTAPLVCTFHGHDVLVRGRKNPAMLAPIHDVAAVTTTTKFMAGVVEDLGFPPARMHLWPQGVDLPDASSGSSRSLGGESPRRPGLHVLTVARLIEFKGFDIALRVIAAARLQVDGLRYTIIGDGALRQDLERQARELHVHDIVTFAGARTHDDVLDAFGSADVFLNMGKVAADGSVEAQGVAPAEASASGLPVVATRVGGLPEVVIDGETGIVVEPLDVEAGAAALARLAADPALRAKMGDAGRRFIASHYSRDVSIDAIERVYREVTA